MYRTEIMHSDKLNGLTGDNGEKYCVFFRCVENPLNSAWAWKSSIDEAKQFAHDVQIKNRYDI